MMAMAENWQREIPNIKGRIGYVFNNDYLSDVQFVVSLPNSEYKGGKKAKMALPAHKFVLAIGSVVFHRMFYGPLAETGKTIELKDCDYESLLELFRYMYTDEVNLNSSNVMQVLYLASKYMVPSLVDKCSEYLTGNVNASNVFSILMHAQKFEIKDLEELCWEIVKSEAKDVVASDEFSTLPRSLVEAVVKMKKLYIKEVELFKAVDRWATVEIEKQGLTPDGKTKRQLLGDEIVKSIKFSSMSQKDFAAHVPELNILTMEEVSTMFQFFSGVLPKAELKPSVESPSRYGHFLRCCRFTKVHPPIDDSSITENVYSLGVTVSTPIFLHGIQLFGSEGKIYEVYTKVSEEHTDIRHSLFEQSGSYLSEKKAEDKRFYVFDVFFDEPFLMERAKEYKIMATVYGHRAWYGTGEKEFANQDDVSFSFSNKSQVCANCNTINPCNDIPALIFTIC